MANKHTLGELQQMQSLSLNAKIAMTRTRIKAWVNEYGEDGVYVSFSGGKDSTVLLHIAREMYPDMKAVFVNTGLEYPEIVQFVKTFPNVDIIRPKMNFRQVIEKYGYPIISKDVAQSVFDVRTQAKLGGVQPRETKLWKRNFDKNSEYAQKYKGFTRASYDYLFDSPFSISHRCCDEMKKKPAKEYEKQTGRHPIIATMASESRLRTTQWLIDGCNAFDAKRPTSKPMSFWFEQDVLEYVYKNNISICSVYGDVIKENEVQGQLDWDDLGIFDIGRATYKTTCCNRTGCMFCMFGCGSKNWDNFTRIKETHPKIYDYIMRPWSEGGLGYKEVIDWINEHGNLDIRY